VNALVSVVLALVLVGCAAPVVRAPSVDRTALWQTHRDRLTAIDSWRLTGRISIAAEDSAWHGALDWRRNGRDYRISLRAPLGSGGVQLQGDAEGVVMETSDGARYEAPDGESLLNQYFGMEVPVDGLTYWILGLPDPSLSGSVELNNEGRLQRLAQAGWTVDFLRYGAVKGNAGGLMLPTKIFVEGELGKVRLVVDQWML
jgi:outer membrane lipoprotein LolB